MPNFLSQIQSLDGQPTAEAICECGHGPHIHDPCCVSACGCDGFEPRKPSIEELFKAVMREIKDVAQDALGHAQICEPLQAVRRLAQEFNAVKAQLAEANARREAANAALGRAESDHLKACAELDEANARAEAAEKRFKDERQHAEWLQSECDKAVADVEWANGKKAKATKLIAKYKPALEAYAKKENWREGSFNIYDDGREIAGYEIAQAALNPDAPQSAQEGETK